MKAIIDSGCLASIIIQNQYTVNLQPKLSTGKDPLGTEQKIWAFFLSFDFYDFIDAMLRGSDILQIKLPLLYIMNQYLVSNT